MSNHIFEELPTRKHAPAAAPAAAAKGGDNRKEKGKTEENSEKRIRQAVYDIRYRARREGVDLKAAFSQYMSHSSLSQAERTEVRAKLFGKEGGMSEQYSVGGDELATNSVANALFKVFVEGIHNEETIELSYEAELSEEQERKYKVRVTDIKNNRSYVRYATREKISQLRSRGLKVEMTEYGEPYEGEKKRGESTARALGGGGKKKLDPVGREDKDVDNDGDHDKSDRYILNRRKAIGKAISMRKEDYLWTEGTTSTEGQNAQKIDVMKKGEVNNVKVFPEIKESANEKFLRMLEEKKLSKKEKKTREKYVKGMKKSKGDFEKRYGEDGESVMYATATKMAMQNSSFEPEGDVIDEYAKGGGSAPNLPADVVKFVDELPQRLQQTFGGAKVKPSKKTETKVQEEIMGICPKCGKSPCECEKGERDTRADKTYRDLLKNKLRAMGMKNPIIMDDIEGEEVMKIMTSSSAKIAKEGREFDEPGEPTRTQRMKVDPGAWKRSMEEWKKRQPEIFDRPGTKLPQAKVNKNTQNKTA